MALPATDSFTNSNGTALATHNASWTVVAGAFAIQSNKVIQSATTVSGGARWNADAFDNDQYSQGVLALNTVPYLYIGVAARVGASGVNFYGLTTDYADGAYLYKIVAGSETYLGSTGAAFSNGDTIRLECEGTTIRPLRNGSLLSPPGAQTDSSLASGAAGLAGYDNGQSYALLDDWEGGNLGGAPAGLSVPVAMFHRRQQGMS